jgi:hypothetical protein
MRSLVDEKTYAKSVSSVFDEDVPNSSVLLKELFDVPLANVVGQVAQKNSASFS